VEQSDRKPLMNGDDENLTTSNPPSPLPLDDGSNSHRSSPAESNFVSSFVRNSARKSLGNGLSMDRWFSAQEKVVEQYEVRHLQQKSKMVTGPKLPQKNTILSV